MNTYGKGVKSKVELPLNQFFHCILQLEADKEPLVQNRPPVKNNLHSSSTLTNSHSFPSVSSKYSKGLCLCVMLQHDPALNGL